MKNFNQMTEMQMSKTQGGELFLVIAGIVAAILGFGTGFGLNRINSK